MRHHRNATHLFNTDNDVSKKKKVKKAKAGRPRNEMLLGNFEINHISSLLENSAEDMDNDFNIDTSR